MRLLAASAAESEGDDAVVAEGDVDAVDAPNDSGTVVVSLVVVEGDGDILTASERGYGKRTPVEDYPRKGRGTQ
ncbi:hypothetical protein JTP67_33700, partial [Streptomyces sp. S12]|nr:hypothetical protein [Streptomyces sp. S12]